MRFHRVEGTGNPPSFGSSSGTRSRWRIKDVKTPGIFQGKFWSHQLRELGRRVKVREYMLIPESDASRHGMFCELSVSVELQQNRSGKEFVEHGRVQQSTHKCSAILETQLKRFLET